MKKNNKGFLLVETLVVSTFCLTVLVVLFLQFRTLIINYNDSFKYNTVEGVYDLAAVKTFLTNHKSKFNNLNVGSTGYIILSCPNSSTDAEFAEFCSKFKEVENIKTLIYTNKKLSNIGSSLNNNNSLSEGMKKFIARLKDNDKQYRLIVEFSDEEYDIQSYASITY